MKVILTGLSYKTAPVEVREQFAFAEAALPKALEALRGCPGVEEALILSTCNRVEVAVNTSPEASAAAAEEEDEVTLAIPGPLVASDQERDEGATPRSTPEERR